MSTIYIAKHRLAGTFAPDDELEIGWLIPLKNGGEYRLSWAAAKNKADALSIVEETKQQDTELEVIDFTNATDLSSEQN